MNRFSTRMAVTLLSVIASGGFVVGCSSNMTEGEKTKAKAEGIDNAADLILRGERNVADGNAAIARGQAIKDQGNAVDGDRIIAEGKTTKTLGESQIAQGRKLREKSEP